MQPFDLERALSGEPVVTEDKRPVTEMHYFKGVRDKYPLHVVIDDCIYEFTKDGIYDIKCPTPHCYSLRMASKKKKNVLKQKTKTLHYAVIRTGNQYRLSRTYNSYNELCIALPLELKFFDEVVDRRSMEVVVY